MKTLTWEALEGMSLGQIYRMRERLNLLNERRASEYEAAKNANTQQ